MSGPYTLAELEALLRSGAVSEPTRAALSERLSKTEKSVPGFFSAAHFQTLKSVCDRLIPQPDEQAHVDVAGGIDDLLCRGSGKGWRYDVLPPEPQMYRDGLEALDTAALAAHHVRFPSLEPLQQDALIAQLQAGDICPRDTTREAAVRFFEELLAAAVAVFYAHPYGKAAIGDRSFADVPGWTDIGLNGKDPQETI